MMRTMKAWGGLAACLAMLLVAIQGHAQSDPGFVGVGDWSGPLEIRFPGNLVENRPVTIKVPSDGCLQSGPRIDPAATTIVREGSRVSIDFHANTMVCFSAGDPAGVWIYDQDLGSFAAGEYTITARYHYIEYPDAGPFAVLNANMRIPAGTIAPATLPALSTTASLLLVLVLVLIAWLRVRRSRLPI